jgi:hypothetical protein
VASLGTFCQIARYSVLRRGLTRTCQTLCEVVVLATVWKSVSPYSRAWTSTRSPFEFRFETSPLSVSDCVNLTFCAPTGCSAYVPALEKMRVADCPGVRTRVVVNDPLSDTIW